MNIWDYFLKALSAIGGVGVIFAFLVLLVQNSIQHWQNMKKQKLDHDHDKELAIANTQLDRKTHIYYKLAEVEFDALREIWDSVFHFTVAIFELAPAMDRLPIETAEKTQEYRNRYRKYGDAHNTFVTIFNKCKPIISKEIYSKCDGILLAGRYCGTKFYVYFCCQESQLEEFTARFWEKAGNDDSKYKNSEKILCEIRDELSDLIRLRFEELSQI